MSVATGSEKSSSKKIKPQPFGRYLLLDRVAAGGMAEVWRAKIFGADDFQRIVAIKKILPHVAEDSDFITMFKDEAKITVLLQHANIGQVYELAKVDETFFIAMEYVPGKDCKTIWQHQRHRKEPLPIPLCCYLVQNIAEGLDYAHRKKDNFGVDLKIVHRDVSPQNVLVSWEGEVKVIDFGIAKAAGKASKTQAGILKGKFGYMAPEQVRGLPIDQRADVFAMGVVLYELLTGQRAFKAESDFSLLEMVRNVELTPPTIVNKDIPDELEKIVFKALAKDPDDRFPWASDLSEALQRFMLLHSKPANRMDMGKYLRENFTVDYDRERLRMEAYREVEMPKVEEKPAPPPPKPEVPAELDRSSAAVLAALAEDGVGGNAAANAFASAPTQQRPGPTAQDASGPYVRGRDQSQPSINQAPPQRGVQTLPPQPSIRPSIKLQPLKQAKAAGKAGGGGLMKYVLISLGALVATVGIGLVLSLLLIGKGTILITTKPNGTQIYLDGVEVGVTENGTLTLTDIKAGPHDIAAQKIGYAPFSGPTNVVKNSVVNLPIELIKNPDPVGTLEVVSTPDGARVIIRDVDTGKRTPTTLKDVVAGDDVKVELKLEGFSTFEKTLSLEADGSAKIEAKLTSLYVTAHVTSEPDGATVYLNGTEQGTTPLDIPRLDPNGTPPLIEVKMSNCQPYTTRLGLVEGESEVKVVARLNCS